VHCAAVTADQPRQSASKGSQASGEVPKPLPAETARTVLEITKHGTLSTIDEDGGPLGTFVNYLMLGNGSPVMRLKGGCLQVNNMLRNPHCSLFVQPNEEPARQLARLTLRGHVEELVGVDAEHAAAVHSQDHRENGGDAADAPKPTDQYFRLVVRDCLHVGRLGGGGVAVIAAPQLLAAAPDPLGGCAVAVVASWNRDRAEDVLRIAALPQEQKGQEVTAAQLLWVDRLGVYFKAQRVGEDWQAHRRLFECEVWNESDAHRMLSQLAQR